MVVYDMDCDKCKHSFYEGDKLRCELESCDPAYPEERNCEECPWYTGFNCSDGCFIDYPDNEDE